MFIFDLQIGSKMPLIEIFDVTTSFVGVGLFVWITTNWIILLTHNYIGYCSLYNSLSRKIKKSSCFRGYPKISRKYIFVYIYIH